MNNLSFLLQERLQVNRLQMGLSETLAAGDLDKVARELKRRLLRASGVDTVIDLYALALIGLSGLLGAEKSVRGTYLASLTEFAETALTRLAQHTSAATSQKLRLHVAAWQVEDAFSRGRFTEAVLLGAEVWRKAERDEGPARDAFALVHARALVRHGHDSAGRSVLASLSASPARVRVEASLLAAQACRAAGAFDAALEALRASPLEKLDAKHPLVLEAGFSDAFTRSLAAADHRPLVTFCRQNADCPPELVALARLKLHGAKEKGALALLPKSATLSRKTKGPARTAYRAGRMAVAVDKLYDTRVESAERLELAHATLVGAFRLPSVDEEVLTVAAVHRWLLRAKATAAAAVAAELIAQAGLRHSDGKSRDPYGCFK